MAASGTALLQLRLHRPLVSYQEPSSTCFPPQQWNRHQRLWRSPSRRSLPVLVSSFSSPDPSSAWEREEARWAREEHRWLREEQRWLREESRWNSEREALLRAIAALNQQIEKLERERSPQLAMPDSAITLETLLRAMKDRVAGADSGSRVPPAVLMEQADVKEMILEEITVSESAPVAEKAKGEDKGRKRRMLRVGAEGEDVRAMQEALQKLGFYSGEEDMEFESYSSGTERAVKTWQASIGHADDGIMSLELLERLLGGQGEASPLKGGGNATAAKGITEETKRKAVKVEEDTREFDVSEHRVFLLGENRWEEPARLGTKNGPIGQRATTLTAKIRCISCRGEGRLMCSECDGTGEPNIEPQFLEWVDEDTKCPYCDGHGFVSCDACGGVAIN
ncbi:plastid transcriptionally active 5 [Wolffia australiana]